MLYEDESFIHRKQAALLTSKVYYHLGAFEDAVAFALGADDLFNVDSASEYVETMITKCIDQYTKLCRHNYESNEKKEIDPKLEGIVNRMFDRCLKHKQFKQAIGIAFETYRTDVFEMAVKQSDDMKEILTFSLKVCMSLIQNRQFRNTVLKKLVDLYMSLNIPAFINVCQVSCLKILNHNTEPLDPQQIICFSV